MGCSVANAQLLSEWYARGGGAATGLYWGVEVTTLTSPDTFGLRIRTGSSIDLTFDWGDGDVSNNVTAVGTVSHEYATAGTYKLKISGTITGGDIGFQSLAAGTTPQLVTALEEIRGVTNSMTTWYYALSSGNNLTNVPSNLFDNQTDLTSIQSAFANCWILKTCPTVSNLTGLTGDALASTWNVCSAMTNATYVNNLTNVTSLASTWANCSAVPVFPTVSNLTKVTSIHRAWSGSTVSTWPEVKTLTNVTGIIANLRAQYSLSSVTLQK